VRTGAKRCDGSAKFAVAGEVLNGDSQIEVVSLFGTVLARWRPAHLLLSLPCALNMHEEDRKFDVRLKKKVNGGGDMLFGSDGCVCPKEG
jgi:hypothetical protein